MKYYRWQPRTTFHIGRYWLAFLLPAVVVGYALVRVWIE